MLRAIVKLKDLGPVKTFIGIEVKRDRSKRVIGLGQSRYIESINSKFPFHDNNYRPDITSEIHPDSGSNYLSPSMKKQYQGAIGAIMWITNNTRPDVAARVGIKAQMIASPTLDDWFDLMKLGRELFETKDEVLRLGGEDELIPEVFVDASWGGHQSDSVMSRSRQGCIVLLGSSCICWWSRVQTVVAQSSADAEYLALSESIKDILYIKSMLEELRIPIQNPVVVHEDNTACVQMVEEGAISRKTRHIAIRERLAIIAAKDDHLVEVCKIKSSDNFADILTKPLARVKIDIVKQRIGIVKL
ncbi:hypothetical protein SeLEV6574_g06603 [Synchytrium endobioticum]|uniref:Uncharacterized protein n=1 Tax=Synchytrium endobioticum TaxID=286115 RepID=A0A507CKV3_9FUNG|nr:hypothetical protein SeLEV6574_g06603 [Synchytrium endobioticum]